MRLSLSKKIFLLFLLFTLAQLVFGALFYQGIGRVGELVAADKKLSDLQQAFSRLEKYPVAGRANFPVDQLMKAFAADIELVRKDLAETIQLERQLVAENSEGGVRVLPSFLGYYEKAFFELLERIEQDAELPKLNIGLLVTLQGKTEKLPAHLQASFLRKIIAMADLQTHIYHARDASRITELKKIANEVDGFNDRIGLGADVRVFVHNIEANHINYLGILDRARFLDDTHRHVMSVAGTTVSALHEKIGFRSQALKLQLLSFALFASQNDTNSCILQFLIVN